MDVLKRKSSRPQRRKSSRPQRRKSTRPQRRKSTRPQRRKSTRPQRRKSTRPQRSRARKSSSNKSTAGGCFQISNKKYASRPGPPFPAQECKNHLKQGNDGEYYKSLPDVNGRYRWVKV